jgi:predicted amidohydrolase
LDEDALKLSLAQYPVTRFADFAAWGQHMGAWVAAAKGELLVFPEYGAMELTALLPPALDADLPGQARALERFHADFVALFIELAKKYRRFILAPTFPVSRDGKVFNRAYLFSPSGGHGFQEKRQMTRFEREEWNIAGGAPLTLFDIGETKIGISICYDIEFPLIAHAMAKAGAALILAPSCTDTLAGANRVHVGARARALENQVYVAVAPLVGTAPWSAAVDVNIGWAAAYAPPDRGFPDDGVLAAGERDRPGWVETELDFDRLKTARGEAQVFTARDWDGQGRPDLAVASRNLR